MQTLLKPIPYNIWVGLNVVTATIITTILPLLQLLHHRMHATHWSVQQLMQSHGLNRWMHSVHLCCHAMCQLLLSSTPTYRQRIPSTASQPF